MLLQFLPLNSVNVSDDSFRMSFVPQFDRLLQSIKSVGIVQPIIVRHTIDGAYQIVSGYRRVLACQQLGRQTIPALVYEHTDLTVLQAFLFNLHDNLVARKLNIIEMAGVLQRLLQSYGIPEDEVVKKYLPLMSEEPSYRVLHQLLAVNQCSLTIRELIVERDYALSTAARIAEFSPSTQEALLTVLKPLKANTGKLNDLLSMIREIAARDAITVEDVLQRYQLLTIVADPAVTPQAKLAALRQTLRGVRLPTLVQRQQQFAGLLRELSLPDQAKLTADPYFEDHKLKLEYQFTAPEQLQALVDHLQQAFNKQSWHKIFDWYQD